MGSGLGWALRDGGARVVSTVEGRSARTARLAAQNGLELLPTLVDTVAAADVVLVVTPPSEALDAARKVASAAREAGASPLVADLNAIAPSTMESVAAALAPLDVVDGSISGPPPTRRPGARLYFSGPRAAELVALPWGGHVKPVALGPDVGSASALKMCTASVYKGLVGVYTQAMRTAGHHNVLEPVLEDLKRAGYNLTSDVALAATKAHRYVGEMREIAATQAGAALTPALFTALAEVFADVATTRLAAGDPETIDPNMPPWAVIDGLTSRISGE
jgi:3-hydroxyisobutyrate dehydrogenase-like beta-hydroxyacid dehydrogenase